MDMDAATKKKYEDYLGKFQRTLKDMEKHVTGCEKSNARFGFQ